MQMHVADIQTTPLIAELILDWTVDKLDRITKVLGGLHVVV